MPLKLPATLEATAKSSNAKASSIATIPKTVLVKGPRVLNSRSTSVVAAGAVADAIAPNNNPSDQESFQSPNKKPPIIPTKIETAKNALIPSNNKIFINCFPYLRRISFFSSPPIINPINPKAK